MCVVQVHYEPPTRGRPPKRRFEEYFQHERVSDVLEFERSKLLS